MGQNLPDDQKIVAYHPAAARPFVPMSAMPTLVVHAFLSAEDSDFYDHPGIDIPLILRAAAIDVFRYASNRHPIGAWTITQQLVKNLFLKIKEVLLALRIERALSKDRILELYLNETYLGCGARGVAEAAFHYFDKSADQLTLEKAAFLARLPKAPKHDDPARFPNVAKAKRNWVVDRMVEDGHITPGPAAAVKALPVGLNPRLPCRTGATSQNPSSRAKFYAPGRLHNLVGKNDCHVSSPETWQAVYFAERHWNTFQRPSRRFRP